jgi:hypothetical protein
MQKTLLSTVMVAMLGITRPTFLKSLASDSIVPKLPVEHPYMWRELNLDRTMLINPIFTLQLKVCSIFQQHC